MERKQLENELVLIFSRATSTGNLQRETFFSCLSAPTKHKQEKRATAKSEAEPTHTYSETHHMNSYVWKFSGFYTQQPPRDLMVVDVCTNLNENPTPVLICLHRLSVVPTQVMYRNIRVSVLRVESEMRHRKSHSSTYRTCIVQQATVCRTHTISDAPDILGR